MEIGCSDGVANLYKVRHRQVEREGGVSEEGREGGRGRREGLTTPPAGPDRIACAPTNLLELLLRKDITHHLYIY